MINKFLVAILSFSCFTSFNNSANNVESDFKDKIVYNLNTSHDLELQDYHWYRQDADGYWSHKQGTTAVKRTDDSGMLITDPETCDRGSYTNFVGYFAVTPWSNLYVQ